MLQADQALSNKTAIQVIDTIYSEVQNGCSAEINILSLSEDSSAKIGDWKVVISSFVGLIHIKGFLRKKIFPPKNLEKIRRSKYACAI